MRRVDLDQRLPVWVAESIVTEDQAQQIRRVEAERDTGTRRTFLAETLGYLGAALAVVAVGMIVADVWDQMEPWAQQVLALLTAVLAIGGGWLAHGHDAPPVQRLVSVLWAAGVVATAFFAGLVAVDRFDLRESAVAVMVSAAVTVVALPLYLARRSPLQQLALTAGALTFAVSVLGQAQAEVPPFYVGLVVWTCGLAAALLAWGDLFVPRSSGATIGMVLLGAGAQVMSFEEYRLLGLVIALATTGAVLAASVAGRNGLLLAFGAVGVFVFVPQLVFEVFEESVGAPIALLVAGLLLVVSGVVLARMREGITAGREQVIDVRAAAARPEEPEEPRTPQELR